MCSMCAQTDAGQQLDGWLAGWLAGVVGCCWLLAAGCWGLWRTGRHAKGQRRTAKGSKRAGAKQAQSRNHATHPNSGWPTAFLTRRLPAGGVPARRAAISNFVTRVAVVGLEGALASVHALRSDLAVHPSGPSANGLSAPPGPPPGPRPQHAGLHVHCAT
ncbi:hypothetical protein AOQ84DRAFT_222846 [Glonium stellatum]|uniref:Uncharacterized protein n=1 Tax=Glonium stellatum TaxID=574774 RepID=A0A8E2EZ00_9PEZI|nr:hypothetical protein AOQ84DRAFT_222846 [Glonium stellatum]